MRKLAICILSALCFTTPALSAEVSVLTWNTEFLWDGLDPEEGRADKIKFPWRGNRALASKRIATAAALIRAANADIVNLVEIEGEPVLQELENQLQDLGYKGYFIKGRDSFTGQDVALLSKIAPVEGSFQRSEVRGTSGSADKGLSKHWLACFEKGGLRFGAISVHLLSRPTDERRKDPRQAQARAVEQMMLGLDAAGCPPIVMGDFNDYDAAAAGPNDRQPISDVMTIIKGRGTATPADDLINVLTHIDQAKRYTSWWDKDHDETLDGIKELSAIDHILVPPELRIKAVGILHKTMPEAFSDHWPVMAVLELTEE